MQTTFPIDQAPIVAEVSLESKYRNKLVGMGHVVSVQVHSTTSLYSDRVEDVGKLTVSIHSGAYNDTISCDLESIEKRYFQCDLNTTRVAHIAQNGILESRVFQKGSPSVKSTHNFSKICLFLQSPL